MPNKQKHSPSVYPFLVFAVCILFFATDSKAQEAIAFINGNWGGRFLQGPDAGEFIEANFKAESDTEFSGSLFSIDPGEPPLFEGPVNGQIQGNILTAIWENISDPGLFCDIEAELNSNFNSMKGKVTCAGFGEDTFELTKQLSFQDTSVSSGISDNTVQTTALQWIDFNGDGKLDLYIVGRNGNALFKNVGKGKFVDVTEQTNTGNDGRDGRGASWADIDNDADLDVFIANATGNPTLLLNQKGIFTDISGRISAPLSLAGTSVRVGGIWMDINNDKEADLYVINDGAPNVLLKQRGLRFTNIASSAGVAFNGPGRSAIAADFNGDNLQDLFLVNFNSPNKLYRNNGDETFAEVSGRAGLAFSGASVQAALSDFDRDKDLDLFVLNNEGASILYRNLGNLKFKIATPRALKQPKKGSAAIFCDYDLDGDEDLVMAQSDGNNLLFENVGKGKFKVIEGIDFSRPDNPTGIAIGDFNNDGLPDIAIGNANDSADHGDSLYENTGGAGRNFINLILQGTESNRTAIGAKVVVEVGLRFLAKLISGGNGQSQESLALEFGLGAAPFAEEIQIVWPSGTLQTIRQINGGQIKANKTYKIIEPK